MVRRRLRPFDHSDGAADSKLNYGVDVAKEPLAAVRITTAWLPVDVAHDNVAATKIGVAQCPEAADTVLLTRLRESAAGLLDADPAHATGSETAGAITPDPDAGRALRSALDAGAVPVGAAGQAKVGTALEAA